MHKSSAWPLAGVYAVLIVYASLYPFDQWRDQDLVPWSFVTHPWTPYWSGFDVVSNWLGYAPLGFWLTLGALHLELRLMYLNTSSIKVMMDMFDRLEDMHKTGRAVSVTWSG